MARVNHAALSSMHILLSWALRRRCMMPQVLQEWATVLDHIKPQLFECVITVGAGACDPTPCCCLFSE